MPRLDLAMIADGNEPTPVDNSPRNSFAAQIATLTPENVTAVATAATAAVANNNPLGLEPSELAASNRAKEAAAARLAATPTPAATTGTASATSIGLSDVQNERLLNQPATTAAAVAPAVTPDVVTPTRTPDPQPGVPHVPYAQLTAAERAAMTPEQKAAYIRADDIARTSSAAVARTSDPMTDWTNRPAAPNPASLPDDLRGMIYYYGWVGGVSSGKWVLYRADPTPENLAKYGSMAFGGPTQATSTSAVGANALKIQPRWNPAIGWIAPAGSNITSPDGSGVLKNINLPVDSSGNPAPTPTGTKSVTTPAGTTPAGVTPAGTTPVPTPTDNPASLSNLTLVSTGTDPVTNATIGYFSDGSSKIIAPGQISQVEKDAYALLSDTFKNYGLDTLVPVIEGYMKANLGSQQAALQLKQTKEYQDRFAGNQLRLAAGLNALPESTYLTLENSYNESLAQYGLKNYFGADRATETANIAKVIGADVSGPEFASRVQTVVDRVVNADPNIKATIQQFYNITDADLIKYYLDPSKDSLAALQQKTTAAEIGTAATEQGLTTSVSSATALAQAGVTQAQAQKGYATIGELVPEAQKLSNIYGEAKVGYDQATAEAEVFNTTGAASAARKRKQLADLETMAFQGKSGINQQVNPLGKGLQGSF